eukprot:GILK01018136.1.p1 GENE.GILK01018136.1~~GILK01018136.1.p1  ORF type:complete len:138 (+),score=20.25 GILK01018136.1:329-742(+)
MYGKDSTNYKTKSRSLGFNLKENEVLREALLNNDVTAAQLCNLSVQQLASNSRQKERELHVSKGIKASVVDLSNDKFASDKYRCSRCKGTDTMYEYVGGVRDIGKSETWGSKDASAAQVQVSCVQCGFQWTQEPVVT